MDKVDLKFLAHIGVEILVIGGVTFYFYKQTSDLKRRVQELEDANNFLMRTVQTMMQGHLPSVQSSGAPPLRSGLPQQRQPQPPQRQPIRPSEGNSQRTQSPLPQRQQSPVQYDEPDFDEEFSDRELDDVIDQELEEECEGGICPIR